LVLSAWLVIVSPGGPKVRRVGQEKEHRVLKGVWGSGRKHAHLGEIPPNGWKLSGAH